VVIMAIGRYRKILVPLDGSDWCERAIPHAIDVAQTNEDSEIILLHILTSNEPTRAEREQYLAEAQQKVSAENVRVRVHIVEGTAVAHSICEYVINEGVNLVVMSTHGRTGLARLFYGSVSRDVMECIDVPVLLIQPEKDE
jgi:nucleotide-binding universal stress UspA family protein